VLLLSAARMQRHALTRVRQRMHRLWLPILPAHATDRTGPAHLRRGGPHPLLPVGAPGLPRMLPPGPVGPWTRASAAW
jgi:hypothetical protein